MRDIGSRLRSERGAVVVEFALLIPLLLMIVVGTIEFGRVYSQFQVFNAAAREGARCAAVQATPFRDCVVQDRIDSGATPYEPAEDAKVSVGGLDGLECDDTTIGDPVTVSWSQPFDLDIPFWGDVTITRTIESTFRCE
jgi:Flp pilus assembly protein TadG